MDFKTFSDKFPNWLLCRVPLLQVFVDLRLGVVGIPLTKTSFAFVEGAHVWERGKKESPVKGERRIDWGIGASGLLLSPKLRVRKRRGEGLMGVRGTKEKAKDHRPREI